MKDEGPGTGRLTVEPVELEMGVFGMQFNLRRDGIDYSMVVHETRNAHQQMEIAKMLQDRLDLAMQFAIEDARTRDEEK
jgi:hypothetical protein